MVCILGIGMAILSLGGMVDLVIRVVFNGLRTEDFVDLVLMGSLGSAGLIMAQATGFGGGKGLRASASPGKAVPEGVLPRVR